MHLMPEREVDSSFTLPSMLPEHAELPHDWPNRTSSRVVTVAGRRWHYQDAGQGDGWLLLHGTGASVHSWRDVLPRLATRFRVLAVDLPGHGFTARRSGERLSLPAMAAALQEFLESVSFRPSVCVGHSAGAAIGLRMALDGSLGATRIIGVNAALLPFGGAWQPVILPITRLISGSGLVPRLLAVSARDPQAVRRLLASTGSILDETGCALYRRLMSDESHVASVLSMMANWDLEGLVDELQGLSAGLALVSARGDRAVSPRQAREVALRVPGCRLVELTSGGHLAHEISPAKVCETLLQLAETRGAPFHA